MMIECRLLHKISMGPIIFIILLPSCPRLLVILMLSVTALCQTLLSPRCLLIAEICLGILVISLKYSFITPAYDLLSLLLKLLLSLPPLTVFVSLCLVSCCSSYWVKPTSGHKVLFPIPPVNLKPITPVQRVPKIYRHSADNLPLSQSRSLHIDRH